MFYISIIGLACFGFQYELVSMFYISGFFPIKVLLSPCYVCATTTYSIYIGFQYKGFSICFFLLLFCVFEKMCVIFGFSIGVGILLTTNVSPSLMRVVSLRVSTSNSIGSLAPFCANYRNIVFGSFLIILLVIFNALGLLECCKNSSSFIS